MLAPHQTQLLELLSHHTPADATERAHLAQIVEFVQREPACFSRATFAPGHITGSAFIVDPLRHQLLLHHHLKLDRWLQMGGHDDGELDAAGTAFREAQEESGLQTISWPEGPRWVLDVDVHDIPARKAEPAHQHLDVRFLLLADAGAPLSMDAQESHALAWIPLEEAAEKMGEVGARRVTAKIERWLASR